MSEFLSSQGLYVKIPGICIINEHNLAICDTRDQISVSVLNAPVPMVNLSLNA